MCIPSSSSRKCLGFSHCHQPQDMITQFLSYVSQLYRQKVLPHCFSIVCTSWENGSFLQRGRGWPSRFSVMLMAPLSPHRPGCYRLPIKVLTVSCLHRVLSKHHVASFSPKIPATFFILGGEKDKSSSKHPKR